MLLESFWIVPRSFWKLDLFYEAKDSERGVFTSEALEEIRSFEGLVKAVEGYEDFCRKRFSEHCDPPYSVPELLGFGGGRGH